MVKQLERKSGDCLIRGIVRDQRAAFVGRNNLGKLEVLRRKRGFAGTGRADQQHERVARQLNSYHLLNVKYGSGQWSGGTPCPPDESPTSDPLAKNSAVSRLGPAGKTPSANSASRAVIVVPAKSATAKDAEVRGYRAAKGSRHHQYLSNKTRRDKSRGVRYQAQ